MSLPPDPERIATRFTECINDRDIDGLAHLISDNHRLVDMEEGVDEGKRDVISAWEGLFKIFPDFKNVCKKVSIEDNLVKIEGYTECSDPRLNGPTLFTAKIEDDKISEWRVYEDNPENRRRLNM